MIKAKFIVIGLLLLTNACKEKDGRYIAPIFKENGDKGASIANVEVKKCSDGSEPNDKGECKPPADLCEPGIPIIIVYDISNSMVKPQKNPDPSDTRMDKARRAAISFIDRLLKGDNLAVVTYESTAEILSDWTEDLASVKDKLTNLEASPPGDGKDVGYTNMLDGLEKAWELYKSAPVKSTEPVVLFLSDGDYELFDVEDPHKERPLNPIVEKFKNAKVAIWSLGFGEAPGDVLGDIAVAPGKYQDGGDGSGLDDVFTSIAIDLCREKEHKP